MSKQIRTILNAAGSYGSGQILEAIGKIAPAISPFIRGAFVAGYAADQIADFLKNQFSTPDERRNQANLEERATQGEARPDERAELSQIEQNQAPLTRISQAGKIGSQAAGYIGSLRAQEQQGAEQRQDQRAQQAQQEAILKQQQEEAAFKRERQHELDAEARNRRAQAEQRSSASEARASEKHKAYMARANQAPKAQQPKQANPARAAKAAGTPPESYLDALRELDELINRLPR